MSARGKKAASHAEASTIYLDRDVAGTVIVERKGRVSGASTRPGNGSELLRPIAKL